MYLDLNSTFTLIAIISVLFMFSLIFTCLCWYWWGAYRDIPDITPKTEQVVDTMNEMSQLETEDTNKNK